MEAINTWIGPLAPTASALKATASMKIQVPDPISTATRDLTRRIHSYEAVPGGKCLNIFWTS